MSELERVMFILADIRASLKVHTALFEAIHARLDHEFSEVNDRLRRLDERLDGFVGRVETLERR